MSCAAQGGLEWVSAKDFTPADYARTIELYGQLYRGKYPGFNPNYTLNFFQRGVDTGWLDLSGLKTGEGNLVGVVGLISRGDWCTTPILGYDLDQPQKLGLYRRLTLKAFLTAEAAGSKLHCSGGAGQFKKQRGAQAAVEYAAVHLAGMSRGQRYAVQSLASVLNRVVAPYLETRVL